MTLPPNPRLPADGPHLQLIESARAALACDPRIAAAWVGGSIAEGTADRWSDVDLRVAVEASHHPALLAAMPDALAAIRPLLGWRVRSLRGEHLVIAVFEGPLRGDLIVTTPAALRRPRTEAAAPLVDPHGDAARYCGAPFRPRRRAPMELIDHEAALVPPQLGRLRRAIQTRAMVSALHAQANLLESAHRMALLLHDPQAAGRMGPKQAAGVLTAADTAALLAPLTAWSAGWPDPRADSIDPTLDVLRPLAEALAERYGSTVPLHPAPTGGEPPAAANPAEAVEAAVDMLLHAMVGAAYYNRGLSTGLLWGYAAAARITADLARVDGRCGGPAGANPDAPAAAPQLLSRPAPADAAALQAALRPLRRGGLQAVRQIAANAAALYSRWLRRACARLERPYPARLDRDVTAYLAREGVFAPGAAREPRAAVVHNSGTASPQKQEAGP